MTDPSGRKEAEDLIGTIGFVDMIWHCLRGNLPSNEFTQQILHLQSIIYRGWIRHA